MSNEKKGFNFIAFLFPAVYYGGKGNFKTGLLLALCSGLPFLMVIPPFYGGFRANKELGNAEFKWGRALKLLVLQMIILGITFSIVESIKKNKGSVATPPVEVATPVAETVAAAPALGEEVTPPTAESNLPESQTLFVKIVTDAQKKNTEAQNDMQKGGIKAEREKAICETIKELTVQDWVGKIKTIDANSDGKGELAIELAQDFSVSNRGTLSDAMNGQEILLEPTSELFKKVSGMAVGQSVKFSGNFFKGEETECLSEMSLTLEGKVSEPEFVFNFASVEAI